MSYAFSFTNKSLTLVLAGFAFVGIMLFTAGLLIGTTWKAEPNAPANVTAKQPAAALPAPTPTATAPAETAPTASAPAALAPTVAPQEPVLTADTAAPEAIAPIEAEEASSAAAPASPARGNSASVRRRRVQTPVLPAPPNDTELRVVQEAEPALNAQRSGGQ